MRNASGYECRGLWLWIIQMRRNDSERQNMKRWWLKVLEGICIMALDAKLKKDDSIECLNKHEKWLWTPKLREKVTKTHEWAWRMALNAKLRKIVDQNAWMGTKDGSERQGWRKNANGCGCGYETTALNAKVQMWLWTLNGKWMMVLNTEWNNDSERQTKVQLWTPNWK